jgi:predicted transcriptional regulator
MRIYENNQRQKPDISVLETGVVMNEILEPISNKQRLDILKAVAFEPKSFSALSKLTALIAGHLHFHLHKLLDGNLILQQHERGDYMITEKGFKILKSLNEMYFSLQYSPPQDSTENTL